MAPILKLDKVTKIYRRGRNEVVTALRKVSLEVSPGEILMVIGPSGSGKTTLLNVLSGLDKPTEGKILFNLSNAHEDFKALPQIKEILDTDDFPKGKEFVDITQWDERLLTYYRRYNVGFIFQSWELIPTLKAVENVESSLYPSNIPSPLIRERAIKLLRKVGLLDKEYAYPDQLSGGEQQRVAICRALIKEPKLIFADEPTGNLDTQTSKDIMLLFQKLNEQGITIVLVTHEPDIAAYTQRIIRMRDGKIEAIA